jgi:hypothetical protein
MPFNINTLKSNIENNGYLKTNSFDVVLVPPLILQNNSVNILGTPANVRNITSNLTFRIEQVRAPGVTLAVSQISPYGVGVPQAMPTNAQLQDISFSILVDGFGEIWQFWYNWVRSIFEFNGTDSARVGAANRLPRYVTEYKDNYSTIMQIVIYDMYGNTIQRINLYEAFPISIREIPLSWNDTGNLMRLAVSISFSEFTIVGSALEGNANQPVISRNNAQAAIDRSLII